MTNENLSHEQFTQPGREFASLTHQGQMYYADRRGDGVSHDQAYADAKYSYGVRMSK